MSSVPEHWIPFLPVRVPGSNREIQLQGAAMPRILDGAAGPPAKVRPRTTLLREGLDSTPPQPYHVHEEQVPRAGARLTRQYQRTRWTGRSRVHLAARAPRHGRRGGRERPALRRAGRRAAGSVAERASYEAVGRSSGRKWSRQAVEQK
jgi:hypothetical protein